MIEKRLAKCIWNFENVFENNGKEKNRKIALLVRSKLNSKQTILSKALINSDVSHEEFTLVINEEPNYLRLKESIKTKDSQLDDPEGD